MQVEKIIQSPFNYTGGKFKLLPQILPLFPDNVDTFVDLFSGGGNVGINVKAKHVIFNDIEECVLKIMNLWKTDSYENILKKIQTIIRKYNLSDTSKYGYEKYNCNSNTGLGDYNKEAFKSLKAQLNSRTRRSAQYYHELYTAIIFAFNNQIRFNTKNEFNLPVGKRDFNDVMKFKLQAFITRLHDIDCTFANTDFRKFNFNALQTNSFVYADPPYLITCASYNENGRWTPDCETALLKTLDNLNAEGIKFALSNVLESKGKENLFLKKWLDENSSYACHHLKHSYSNANYQRKETSAITDEVLITNY